jgi:hypothetical protein
MLRNAMVALPTGPLVYEINTWPWLAELSRAAGAPLTLGDLPDAVWDELAGLGMDAIWLAGVWERSPAGVEIAMANAELMAEFRAALPDLRDEDIVGSAYCIRRYEADERLGGRAGLAAARETTLGPPSTRATISAATTPTSSARPRSSCGRARWCWPGAATRSSPPGPTWCS